MPASDLSEVMEEPSYDGNTVGWSGTSLAQIQQYRLDRALRGGALQRASLVLPSDARWLRGSPVAISPDARLMLVVSPPTDSDSRSRLKLDVWDLEAGQRLQTLKSCLAARTEPSGSGIWTAGSCCIPFGTGTGRPTRSR